MIRTMVAVSLLGLGTAWGQPSAPPAGDSAPAAAVVAKPMAFDVVSIRENKTTGKTDPAEAHTGMKMPFGGVMVPAPDGMKMYGISAGTLATFLSSMMGGMGRPIVDKTGLPGRYDMTMMMRERMGPGMDPGSIVPMMLEDLGLKLEAGKAPLERLVIDHVERPSAN